MTEEIKVAYLGTKEIKRDTVTGSGLVWAGFGDVVAAPKDVAAKLFKFPTVWGTEERLEELRGELSASLEESESTTSAASAASAESAESAESAAPKEPAMSAELIDQITNAIMSLDSSAEGSFTQEGKPKVAAVQALMPEGVSVNAKQVAEVFATLSK